MRYNKEIKNDMTRKLYFTILSQLFISTIYAQYVPDILGDNYLRRTIQMPDDYEGKVVCTLVKKPQLPETKQAILYIHGYNDYFFQKQLGDSVNAHGYNRGHSRCHPIVSEKNSHCSHVYTRLPVWSPVTVAS